MDWAFLYLMVFLKLPIAALLWIVWWAIRAQPDATEMPEGDDGGTKTRPRHERHPRPRHPRRGPHSGSPAPAPPPRTRAVVARSRPTDRA